MGMINADGLHQYQITAELLNDDNQVVKLETFMWMSRLTISSGLGRFIRKAYGQAVRNLDPPIKFAVRVTAVKEVV